MKTKKSPQMPFAKKAFCMPNGGSSCCDSFMAGMKQFESCCDVAAWMGEAGIDCGSSSEQNENGSETTEESEDG